MIPKVNTVYLFSYGGKGLIESVQFGKDSLIHWSNWSCITRWKDGHKTIHCTEVLENDLELENSCWECHFESYSKCLKCNHLIKNEKNHIKNKPMQNA